MVTRVICGIAAAGLVAVAGAGSAEDLAEVTKVEKVATAAGIPVDSVGYRLQVGDLLQTDVSGRLGVFFRPRKAARRSIELGPLAKIELVQSGKFYKVPKGTVEVSGQFGDVPLLTGNARIRDIHSTLVVTYDPESNVTGITVIDGSVAVANLKGGRERTVLAREYTRVVGDLEPTSPEFLEDEEYERNVAPFVFSGRGRPESLNIGFSERTALPPPQIEVYSWPWPGEKVPFEITPKAVDDTLLGIDF